jgi:hypothetical protein
VTLGSASRRGVLETGRRSREPAGPFPPRAPIALNTEDARLVELLELVGATGVARERLRALGAELSELISLLPQEHLAGASGAELSGDWIPPLGRLLAQVEQIAEARLLARLSP